MPQPESSNFPSSVASRGDKSSVPIVVPEHLRSWGFLISFGCAVVLVTAWHLEADYLPLGPGSQISFPECALRDRTGYPCPTCGMTTAWARAVRGDLVTALRANIAGAVLAIAAALGVVGGTATAVLGRVFYIGVARPVVGLLSSRGWLYGLLGLILFAWGWNALWVFIGQRGSGP